MAKKEVTGSFDVYDGDEGDEWIVVATDSRAEEMPTLAVFTGDDAETAARKLAETLQKALTEYLGE